ncbi:MAG: hypothetical protein HDQ96_04695 [Lachnospiraceae bacterium]|nr:hypothetical protein [Lachnospiraceae bacterium]
MILYVQDNKAVCPSCSGMVTARQNFYFCSDCGSAYIGIGHGRVEGEVIVETVGKEK